MQVQDEWYAVVLTRDELEKGTHECIRDTFKRTVEVNENLPTDVGIYVDTDRGEDGSRVIYFSPNSFSYFRDTLERFGYQKCARPDGHAVEFVKFV